MSGRAAPTYMDLSPEECRPFIACEPQSSFGESRLQMPRSWADRVDADDRDATYGVKRRSSPDARATGRPVGAPKPAGTRPAAGEPADKNPVSALLALSAFASTRRSAAAAADAFAAAASARDIGWWGEKSEERVFHEMANMREMALDSKMKTTETKNRLRRDARDASRGRQTEINATTTAFRLSARGLRY